MQLRRTLMALAVASAATPMAASAVEFQAGDYTINLGGFVDANYITVSCTGSNALSGFAIATRALGCGDPNAGNRTTVGNGLLPDALITSVKTKQAGYDIGATIFIGVHTATDSGLASNSGVDVRQAFFTVGNENGTVKLGRDYGAYGANAILGDMVLLGSGAATQATQRGRVTLGHIGAGYTYLDNYGQISYTTPASTSPFALTAGVYSPINTDAGLSYTQARSTALPQFQAVASFKQDTFKGWVGAKYQEFKRVADQSNYHTADIEFGASYSILGIGLLGNFQYGKGLGILSDGDSDEATGQNFLLQATYDILPELKVGVNYGQSKTLDNPSVKRGPFDPTQLNTNDNYTVGLYYKLTKSITLALEGGRTTSKAFNKNTARQTGGSIGGIIFF